MRNIRHSTSSTSFYGYFPPGVKWLLIINVGMFVLMTLAGARFRGDFLLLALTPQLVVGHFAFWQLLTYLFLHGGIGHLLFNMLSLWMFGSTLERDWGTRYFLKYYLLCGIGAGVCDVLANAVAGSWNTRTIGASGAIYGLLLAFGVLYPNQTVLMNFLFPIRAKYLVMIYGAIALYSAFGENTGVSNIAHLGGMLFGYLYLKFSFTWFSLEGARRAYRDWRLRRNKKRFQVYLRKHGGNDDRWVN
jgi:membrane associated rhomboid family serine protease